ncbi:hypothetical protein AWC38_SpisGene21991 [Stylophora pistillata]|uniref:DUF3504 domain-containing protein n=1 Tax=Stylophora pistillata TaxID=50429 RepID=A0A2B4R9R8_STYPI|nr:hypothetical protein AWC38_SpisGene21991 [Stylophora pistillata]
MASQFASVTSEEITQINDDAVPENTKKATKFGLAVFKEWFPIQKEFTTPSEEMSPPEQNKCLQKFYLSATKRDGSFYNKKSLTAIRAALDRHLRSPPFSKPFSIIGDSQFNDANISLSNFLKTLSKSGQIAPTMHKQPLTKEIVAKLYEEGELVDTDSLQPHKLQQTAWFFISLFLGKRGRENQQLLKRHMLVLRETPSGEKYLEMSRERGAVLATKTHQGGLDDKEDESNGKIFQRPSSKRCPVKLIEKCRIPSAAVYSRNREVRANRLTQQDMLCGWTVEDVKNCLTFQGFKEGTALFSNELDFGPADKVSGCKASSSLEDITTKSAAIVVLIFLEVNSMQDVTVEKHLYPLAKKLTVKYRSLGKDQLSVKIAKALISQGYIEVRSPVKCVEVNFLNLNRDIVCKKKDQLKSNYPDLEEYDDNGDTDSITTAFFFNLFWWF